MEIEERRRTISVRRSAAIRIEEILFKCHIPNEQINEVTAKIRELLSVDVETSDVGTLPGVTPRG